MPQPMHSKTVVSAKILESILKELRLLREEARPLLPQEKLGGYANPEKIKRAYQRAIKNPPPVYGDN